MDSLTTPFEQVALITGQKDGLISVLDFKTNTQLLSLKQNQCNKNCISLISQTNLNNIQWGLISCAFDKPLGMTYGWEKELPLIKFTLPEKLTCLEVSPTGKYCAGGAESGKIYIWELITGRLLNAIEAHYKAVSVIRFSKDEQLLISGSLDSIIHIWSLNQFQPSKLSSEITPKVTLSDHTLAITDIRVGLGGRDQCRIYSTSLDHTCKIWKLNQGKLLGTLIFPSPVNCLAIDSLERKLSVGCQNNSIYSVELYKPCQGQSLLGFNSIFNETDLISVASMDSTLFSALLGHDSSVVDISYNWSSNQLISGDQTGYLMVWDVNSKQRINSYSIFKGGITNLKIFTLPSNLTNLNQLKSIHPPVVSLQRMIISDPNDKSNTHLTIFPKKVNFEIFPPSSRVRMSHFTYENDDDEVESKCDEGIQGLKDEITKKQDNLVKLDELLKSLEKSNSDQYKSELSKFIK